MDKDNIHLPQEADTYSLGSGLSIYTNSDIKKTISVTNNKAHYYANLAKKFRDEAKVHCDNAKYYAEENSNVTYEQLIDVRVALETEIDGKQDVGNYALKSELPVNISELENDSNFATTAAMNSAIDSIRLPDFENNFKQFLTNDGENLKWEKIPREKMFCIKLFDRVLSPEESKGYAMQGTYVYKESAPERYGYPDFYNKCLEEKATATITQTTLGENTITTYNNVNGHIFYDISDKSVVDAYYNTNGIVWMYGIDTENERIFLPRIVNRKIVESYTNGTYWRRVYNDGWCEMGGTFSSSTWSATPANLTFEVSFGKTFKDTNYHMSVVPYSDSDFNVNLQSTRSNYRTDGATLYFHRVSNATYGQDKFNAYKWEVKGFLGEDEYKSLNEYLYYIVGNTEQESAITDVIEITTSENDTMPLFTGMYFDFAPNNVSWLKAGEQANSGGIYTSCYNTLVSCLTAANNIYNIKVIAAADMVADTDYSEYWKVNQDEMWFKTPVSIGLTAGEGTELYFKVANALQNLELLDAGEVLETLANKISRQDCKAYITEAYKNGTSWYRIWSDGWCEQGGSFTQTTNGTITQTVNLLKNYSNVNYSVYTSGDVKSLEQTTSSFEGMYAWGQGGSSYGVVYWQTKGYLAEGGNE